MSVTVPSSSNQIVLGMASTYPNGNNNPITVDGTQRWNANTVTNNINSTGNEKTGGGAVTLNWTGLQAFQWTTIGIPINAATRTEKIAISRHYDGTVQYIYAQVYNGSSWGNVVLLSSWTASTFLDVQNFDGTYLANGNFMVVYSDNTVIPKMQTWNGTAWSGQTSLTTLGTSQIPNYVVLSTRPGTNEAMAAFFTQGSSSTTAEAITEYYSGSAWSAITTHSTAAPSNTRRYVDFAWSPNTTTIGALVYTNSSTDKTLRVRLWLANGSGGGAWGTAVARSTSQTNTFGAVSVIGVNGSTEFAACDKDTAVTPTINCYKVTYVSNAATWVTPTNSAIAAATDTGLERSFHLAYESNLGGTGEIVYSDNTNIPKLKTYTQSTSTWDAAATTISTGSFTLGVVKSVRAIPSTGTNDIAFFLTDANLGLYSVFWNGASNAVYTTSDGRAFTQHGTNGSATTEFWYDYAVDQF